MATLNILQKFKRDGVDRDNIIDPVGCSMDIPIEFHEASEYADFLPDDNDPFYHVFKCPICEQNTAEFASYLSHHGMDFYEIFD